MQMSLRERVTFIKIIIKIYDIVSERWNKFMTDVNAGYWRAIEMGVGVGGT